jgi:thiosulfate/3-mercaptopyruvate sulfurtransferase
MLTTLVDVHTLAKHLDDPAWVVVDCRFALTDPGKGQRAWQTSHIPGARYAHLDNDLSSPITPATGRHPLPDPAVLAKKIADWGIHNHSQVVVYDDTFGAMAARLWWLLRWLGHHRVALLDGGFPRWQREKLPVTAEKSNVTPAHFVAAPDNSLWVTANDVMQALTRDDRLILDARAEERFTGEVEPLDKVAGHIPGARNAPYEDNLDFSGEFMSDEALREHYNGILDGRPADDVIVMCGSGVTACHNLVALEHAGLRGAKLYAGSWSEWITDPTRPVAKGL